MEFIYPVIDKEKTGLIIKRLRQERRFTVEELAEVLDQSPQAIYKWQRGECIPTIDNLYAMSKLFGTPIDSLIRGDREEEEIPLPFFAFLNHRFIQRSGQRSYNPF